jgi:hypothetical protein
MGIRHAGLGLGKAVPYRDFGRGFMRWHSLRKGEGLARRTEGRAWVLSWAGLGVWTLWSWAAGAQSNPAPAQVAWLSKEEGQVELSTEGVPWDEGPLCAAKFSFEREGAHSQRALLRLPATPFTLVSISHCKWCQPEAPLSRRVSVVVHSSPDLKRIGEPLSVVRSGGTPAQSFEDWLERGGNARALGRVLPKSLLAPLLGPNEKAQEFVSHWTRKLRGDQVDHYLLYRPEGTNACVAPEILASAQLWDAAPSSIERPYAVAGLVGTGPDLPSEHPAHLAMALRSARIEYVRKNGRDRVGYCTGLLLGGRAVLTARHCIQECVDNPNDPVCGSYSMDVGFSVTKYVARDISDSGSYSEPLTVPRSAFDPSTEPTLDYVVLEAAENVAGGGGDIPNMYESLLVGSPGGYLTTISRGKRFFDRYPGKDGPRLLHTCFAVEGLSGAPLWDPAGAFMKPVGIHTTGLRPCVEGSELFDSWTDLEDFAKATRPDWYAEYAKFHDQTMCIGQAISLAAIYDRECAPGRPAALGDACVSLRGLAKQGPFE